MLTTKYYNQLFAYTLGVNESPEMAEKQAGDFEQKFNTLGKYDQLTLSITMESGNWEEAIEALMELDAFNSYAIIPAYSKQIDWGKEEWEKEPWEK